MRKTKRYTNATFTKRVDHEGGRHRPSRAMKEPAVCDHCGSVYVNRRWSKPDSVSANGRHPHWRPSKVIVCPACKQQLKGEPRGFVFLEGAFVLSHRPEIEQLLRNEATRAAEDNPLARILTFNAENEQKLIVSTTTEHLAQRLGHALEKAFAGEAAYDFSHENKLARVHWRRD